MDSISQALWGALSAEAAAKPEKKLKLAPWVIGLGAGTFPDLDVIFSFFPDPILGTLLHRHFTHSILFIPIGALLVWLCFLPFFHKEKKNYLEYYRLAFFGYSTHWILDYLTAYGTLIFWPISNTRFALDLLSIVDPLLTLPWLIVLAVIYLKRKKQSTLSARGWARGVLLYSVIYIGFTGALHVKARSEFHKLLNDEGVSAQRVRLLPSLGNSFWFRGLAVTEQQLISYGVFIHPFTFQVFYRQGEVRERWFEISSEKFSQASLENQKALKRQVEIYSWFTDGTTYLHEEEPIQIGDGRYSSSVAGFDSLWALRLDFENPNNSKRIMVVPASKSAVRNPFEGYTLLAGVLAGTSLSDLNLSNVPAQ